MVGETSSVKGVLMNFLTPIFTKNYGEPTRAVLIEIHQFISGNAASVASNLGGGRHGHLALTMTAKYYRAQSGFAFVLPHNPGNYPYTMGNAQEQALRNEKF